MVCRWRRSVKKSTSWFTNTHLSVWNDFAIVYGEETAYLATCLSRVTEISGIPQTNCSSLSAVYSDRMGRGIIEAIPPLTASACKHKFTVYYNTEPMKCTLCDGNTKHSYTMIYLRKHLTRTSFLNLRLLTQLILAENSKISWRLPFLTIPGAVSYTISQSFAVTGVNVNGCVSISWLSAGCVGLECLWTWVTSHPTTWL